MKPDPEADGVDGYHKFVLPESGIECGSFEVFYVTARIGEIMMQEHVAPVSEGWYWWQKQEGLPPEYEEHGPFNTSQEAFNDAQRHSVRD